MASTAMNDLYGHFSCWNLSKARYTLPVSMATCQKWHPCPRSCSSPVYSSVHTSDTARVHSPCPRPVDTTGCGHGPWTQVVRTELKTHTSKTIARFMYTVRKTCKCTEIRHDTSVKFTEQVPCSFFPLVYGIKCVSVTFHCLSIPTEYQVSRKFMPILPMTEVFDC